MSENNTPAKTSNKDREIGALWLKTSAAGNQFCSGTVKMGDEVVSVVMFREKAENKKNPNQPDYRIYLSTPRDGQAAPAAKAAPAKAATPKPAAAPQSEEVPF